MALETATRVCNVACQTGRLLAKQFNTNADVFGQTDPTPAGTPLTLTSATGITGMDGTVTLGLGAGYTAPLLLKFFVWQQDNVTAANSHWRSAGNASTGTQAYQASVDKTYATLVISFPNNTPFFIMADQSVTGNVYTDAHAHPSNNNSVANYST